MTIFKLTIKFPQQIFNHNVQIVRNWKMCIYMSEWVHGMLRICEKQSMASGVVQIIDSRWKCWQTFQEHIKDTVKCCFCYCVERKRWSCHCERAYKPPWTRRTEAWRNSMVQRSRVIRADNISWVWSHANCTKQFFICIQSAKDFVSNTYKMFNFGNYCFIYFLSLL